MLNLIRADFKRLIKSKLFWIAAAAITAVMLMLLLVIRVAYGGVDVSSDAGGLDMSSFLVPLPGAKNALSLLSSGSLYIIIVFGLISSTVICMDFSQGTIQSYFISGNSRVKIFLAKTLITYIAVAIMLTAVSVIITAVSAITSGWGGTFSGAAFAEFIGRFFLMLIMYAAIMSIINFLSYLTRKTGAVIGISVALAYVFFLLQMLGSVSELMALLDGGDVHPVFKVLNIISRGYVGTQIAAVIKVGGEAKKLVEPVLVMLVTTALMLTGSILIFRRKDLK
ncbi:MAG: ABC transporter permease [Clostridiales bacterium]|jgi:ABC-2 type transport system permease protein|nr:ABC transporter permease [Clostridiales bacterium]